MLRKARYAGTWYPSDRKEWRALYAKTRSIPSEGQPPKAAVLPHAGLAFSLRGMTPLFKKTDPRTETVIILSPSHYTKLEQGFFYTGAFTALESPTGEIPAESPSGEAFRDASEWIEKEHGIEMFLPWLPLCFPRLKRVAAILVPDLDLSTLVDAPRILREAVEHWDPATTLWIASSDFTHYGPRFGYQVFGLAPLASVEARVAAVDKLFGMLLTDGDLETAFEDFLVRQPTICGFFPAWLVAALSRGEGWRGKAADYYNSNAISAPTPNFVAYQPLLFGEAL